MLGPLSGSLRRVRSWSWVPDPGVTRGETDSGDGQEAVLGLPADRLHDRGEESAGAGGVTEGTALLTAVSRAEPTSPSPASLPLSRKLADQLVGARPAGRARVPSSTARTAQWRTAAGRRSRAWWRSADLGRLSRDIRPPMARHMMVTWVRSFSHPPATLFPGRRRAVDIEIDAGPCTARDRDEHLQRRFLGLPWILSTRPRSDSAWWANSRSGASGSALDAQWPRRPGPKLRAGFPPPRSRPAELAEPMDGGGVVGDDVHDADAADP